MRIAAKPSPNQSLARASAWAGLWLACLGALLSWTSDAPKLSAALTRRLPILALPLHVLARFVMSLILLRALARYPAAARSNGAGAFRAILRAGLHRQLAGADGYTLAALARIARDPEPAIAAMLRALRRGLTRRRPILPRASADALRTLVTQAIAHADTS